MSIAVLISGRGSNLQALIAAARAESLGGRIAIVISNRADAEGLTIARAAGIETLVIPHGAFPSREAYDLALVEALRARQVTLVCLAGFMRLVSRVLCDAFPNAILNIHPSLLPAFPGPDAQRQALEHGVKVTGATVHFVVAEMDAGPIIMQGAVAVRPDDTEAALAARVLAVEHRIYPSALKLVAEGRVRVVDGRCLIDGVAVPDAAALVPSA